ncbi:P-loop containing nucleoside triphosphate hydrolase protein [Aspergillus egyptiacus]|nr:P-loop containing nucleoside triphosphate hydrolase protein [Aspergillus egyptiacus]
MDLLSILPDFSVKSYAHILPPLERSRINTVDLISLDTLEIAKRAHVPPADVRRLAKNVIKALHHDAGFDEAPRPENEESEPDSSFDHDAPLIPGPRTQVDLSRWCAISTLDPEMDNVLNGGIPTGYLTEVTGESGSGKTQFLLNLLLAVQLTPPRGAGKSAIYISTEAPLATNRLSQLIECHPYLSSLSRDEAPSLRRILSINAMDLESQDHILNYQLPVAVKRYNVGLVVIDSITSNYRAEHTSHDLSGLSTRSGELAKLGQMLRNLAADEDIAIVVANQVSDRFEGEIRLTFPRVSDALPFSSPATQQARDLDRDSGAASPLPRNRSEQGNVELNQYQNTLSVPSTPTVPSSSPAPTQEDPQQQFDGSYVVGNPIRNEILSLQHQQRFFTGWGDSSEPVSSSPYPGLQRPTLKTPTLGLVWSTQIACRIALKKLDRSAEFGPAGPALDENSIYPGAEQVSSKEQADEAVDGSDPKPSPPTASSSEDAATTASPNKPANEVVQPPLPSPSNSTEQSIQRTMKLAFSPWAGGLVQEKAESQDEVEFEIWKGGLRAVGRPVAS